jgi:Domain of unknown function (DUF4124)
MSVWRIAICLGIFWVGLAWGQIYKWTDPQGSVHLTDDPGHIPPEHRSKVDVETASPPAPLPLPHDDVAKPPPIDVTEPSRLPTSAPPRDLFGRGPDYWQQLAEQWSTRLQQHIQERDRLQLMYDYTRQLASYTRDVFDRGRLYADITRLEKAIGEAEAQIKEAETMLQTTLPLEARRLGANPDWLNPPAMTQP